MESRGYTAIQGLNLFGDLLHGGTTEDLRQDRKGRTRSAPARYSAGKLKSTVPSPVDARAGLLWWRLEQIGSAAGGRSWNAAHRTRATAGTRDHYGLRPKLQKVNRRRRCLASAAHEVEKPLAVIKGYYDLLLAVRWAD